MKKFIFRISAVAILMMPALTSCEDEKEATTSEVQKDTEVQIDAVVTELSKYDELSEFNTLLQELYIADIQTEEFTVFAIKNGGMDKSADEGVNLRHHIVARKYSKSSLIDRQQITALDGTVLRIVIMGGYVYVNGVELGEEIPVGNSVVYVVEEPITTAFNTTQYSFVIYECNSTWSPDNSVPYHAASGAEVSLRDSLREREFGPYKADADGKLTITLVNGLYSYKVTKGAASNISKDGFIIAGIFTSQEDFYYLQQPSAVLGGLRFVDINGDGRITDDDKPYQGFVWYNPQYVFDVYIAAADFTPTYEP